jgi:vancomycin permeability regulator SanA
MKRRLTLFLVGLVVVIVLLLSGVLHYVGEKTSSRRFSDPTQIPSMPIGIVFGAGIHRDGTLSRILQERVDAAIDLYDKKKIRKLLMTGDNSSVDYDEVSNMRRYAVEHGVPTEDITLDYAGFNTYDSCYRAQAIFGVSRAILVTQNYHMSRALYTCSKLGIQVVGLAIPDFSDYPFQMLPYQVREVGSTLKMLVELHITHELPTVLGKKEPIGF